ncbi:MAG: site-2 protease family protein [Demequinaceae bacterium]|nr:site-2 protease family protein [Demequinaceae bacterium]
MAYAIGVIVFIIGISISVALHELGHMLPAKAFGVKVPRYMIGFGPTLWSRKRGETEYGVKAFPLGGYVKLMGMVPPASEVKPVRGHGWAARLIEDTRAAAVEEIEQGEEHRSFYRLVWWKRVIVMAGGTFTNLFLAILIFTGIGVFYGVETTTPRVDEVLGCVLPIDAERDCTAKDPETAASLAGFENGDRIVAVDGMDIDGWEGLTEYIRVHPGDEVAFTVQRQDEEIVLTATLGSRDLPVYKSNGEPVIDGKGDPVTIPVGFLGVQPSWEMVRQSPWWGTTITFEYLGEVGKALAHLPDSLWNALQASFGWADRDQDGIVSIFGAGRFAGEIAAVDSPDIGLSDQIAAMLQLVAAINLALFAFNLVPLTPLDGGHVAGGLWQGVKDGWARLNKRPKAAPVDLARMMPLTYVVFVLLVVMGAVFAYADLVVPIRIG